MNREEKWKNFIMLGIFKRDSCVSSGEEPFLTKAEFKANSFAFI